MNGIFSWRRLSSVSAWEKIFYRHGLLHHLGDQDHPLRGLQQPAGPEVEEVVATEPGMLNYFVSINYVIGLLFTLMFQANYIPLFALIAFFLGSGH